MFQTWVLIGPSDSKRTYSKQRIFCKLTKAEVTLTAQSDGVVICSNWKKCKNHMKEGLKPCPVVIAEKKLLKTRLEDGGKKIKFIL